MSEKLIALSEPTLTGLEAKYLADCVASGWLSTAGPWVKKFEQQFAARVQAPLGSDGAVAVASGTAALHLALIATGVGAGDEVIVPTLTFIAPVNTVRYVSAEPVFMDCDEFLNMDLKKLRSFLEQNCVRTPQGTFNSRTQRRVKAVIPVHVFGHPIDVTALMKIAEEFGLTVIEDSTEALGSTLPSGKPAGTEGHIGCYSFNGNKIITTGGGGMIVSRDPKCLAKMRYLSTQAKNDELLFVHDEVGYNYRLSSVSSAVGLAQLENLDRFMAARRKNFEAYAQAFQDDPKLRKLGNLIFEPTGGKSNYWLTTLLLKQPRDLTATCKHFEKHAIQVRPVWKLCHEQKPYAGCEAYGITRSTELYPRLLSLPSSSHITDADRARVIDALLKLA